MRKLIIYGAGVLGIRMLRFLQQEGLQENVLGFCDKRFSEICEIDKYKVYSPVEAVRNECIFLIAARKGLKEIAGFLSDNGCKYCNNLMELATELGVNPVEFERAYCAYAHKGGVESYFERAESQLALFWDESTQFYKEFKKLDLTNVIELACGKGRHVQKYIDCAGHITLVDILEDNIEFCKNRFNEYKNITYYVNNGHDLSELQAETYTAIFSYDAMVHFEMLDIYEYLKEFYRVLKKGSYALIHHSNISYDYKVSFETGEGSRNYMSKDLFAYLAYRSGFQIINQTVIDWVNVKESDCISLLYKA